MGFVAVGANSIDRAVRRDRKAQSSARWACEEKNKKQVSGKSRRLRRFQRQRKDFSAEMLVTKSSGTEKQQELQELQKFEIDDERPEEKRIPLESCPALVLNADYQPLSYMPLSLWPWQEVVKAVFLERVVILATYDFAIRSPSVSFELPSVIALKKYQSLADKRPAFTRYNVFVRDDFKCQYCGTSHPPQELTFDHVVPRSRGGKGGWENVVTACVDCNYKKGSKLLSQTPDLQLIKKPVAPNNGQLQSLARKYPPKYLHSTWRDYVYWDETLSG